MESNAASSKHTFHALTIARFFAAFGVVLCHYQPIFFSDAPIWVSRFCTGGFNLVSFFFLLSGFLLASAYWNRDLEQSAERTEFWIRRLARIYPAYFFWMLITFPFFVRAMSPIPNLPTVVGIHVLLLQAWKPNEMTSLGWNGPTWSVSCELFFYATFPLWFGAVRRMSAKACLNTLGCLYLAIQGIALFAFSQNQHLVPEVKQTLSNFFIQFPTLRIFEFAFGAVLYSALQQNPRWQFWCLENRTTLIASCAIAYVAISQLGTIVTKSQGLPTLVFALAIVVLWQTKCEPTRRTRPWILLGEASYSLYLLQIPLYGLFYVIARRLIDMDTWSTAQSLPLGIGLTGVAIALSIASHRWIEVPGQRLLLSALKRAKQPPQQPA